MEVMEKKCAILARQTAAMARLLSGCAAADAVAVEVAIDDNLRKNRPLRFYFAEINPSKAKSQPAAAFCTLRDANNSRSWM